MDGRTLMDIMQSPNFSMWGPAEQAFNTTQDKAKADLASVLGMEKRAQEIQPVEIASKQAATALNKSTAALNQYALDTKLPKEQALQRMMQKFHAESDDDTRAQTHAQIVRSMQIAAAAKNNGGMLPEGIQLSPQEMKMYSPGNLDSIIKFGTAYLENSPEELAKRKAEAAKKEAAVAAAAESGRWRVQAAGTARPGSGGTKVPKSPRELLAFYTFKANSTEDENEKAQYEALAEQQWQMIQQEAILKAQAPNGGKVDPVATANTGVVTPKPQPTPKPMPKPGGTWAPPNGWK